MNASDAKPISILLQTTIQHDEDNWNIERFSMLRDLICGYLDGNARQLTRVTARDREADANGNDPVLASIARSDFDQVWLIGVDAPPDTGLSSAECKALTEFRRAGGAIMSMRDHQDLGASICSLGGIGSAHHFHSKNPEPEDRRQPDDPNNPNISWPNYHSGENGDVQYIEVQNPIHTVLHHGGATIRTLPAHPHEGSVDQPSGDATARVVVTGMSSISHRPFNIAVAFEAHDGSGRGWAESTFHHFADYNWDISRGCPSFVTDVPSQALQEDPALLDDTKRYVRNLVEWLGRRVVPAQPARRRLAQYQVV